MTAPAPPPLPDPETLRRRLEELRARRGFLLAHHGAMAAATPDLHEAYLQMYRALTVTPRHLSPLEKESVWLAVLVTTREAVGTHHLELFRQAGGSLEAAERLLALAGHAAAHDTLAFAGRHWGDFLPGFDAQAAYARGIAALRGDAVPEATVELAMLAVQAARHSAGGVAHHIRRGYALGLPEEHMVEALSYLMWPCGVNAFLDACAVWHELMLQGAVSPSPRFRVWAEAPAPEPYRRGGDGQGPGGFD